MPEGGLNRKVTDALPHKSAIYPRTLKGQAARVFWSAYTPAHPYIRDLAIKLRIVDQQQFLDRKGRQPYRIGTIASTSSVDAIVQKLVAQGYGNNFVAWHDAGEVASLRLPVDIDHQYHVRIFADNEVRGHYELTPEMHPWKHYREIGMEERPEYFKDLLGDMVV